MYCDWPDLGRCCFCLPLRRGLIGLAYLNLLFNAFMIGVYSLAVQSDESVSFVYHGTVTNRPFVLCITLYCIEVLFGVVLLYGSHMKSVRYLKVYYYFAISTIVAALLVQILELFLAESSPRIVRTVISSFCGFSIQLYMITLIRSLMKRLERSGPLVYENQLQQIVSGEARIESNGVYNNTTVVPRED